MKKRTLLLATLLIIVSTLLLACNKADTIICNNCSAVNPSENQYCSSCGVALTQNITTPTVEIPQAESANENTEATDDNSTPNIDPPVTQPPQQTPTTQQPTNTSAHTHNYSAATCTSPKTCSCGATSGNALGHSYKSENTAPTCTSQGYTTYACSTCGNSYKDNYVNASHNYENYKCTSCGAIDKANAYSYLEAWVKEHGKADGSFVDIKYESGNSLYGLSYDAISDSVFIRRGGYNDNTWTYTSLDLNSYYYGTSYGDITMRGYIKPASFTSNTAISYATYNGSPDTEPYMANLARLNICDLIEWLDWYLNKYNVGITISDLGFKSY